MLKVTNQGNKDKMFYLLDRLTFLKAWKSKFQFRILGSHGGTAPKCSVASESWPVDCCPFATFYP